ncbi:MAG: alpha/beta hydrolase [Verrucomicrobia bacterium]|nr:alpha/beta hydrolase [Verrucomicrobiota bacterium]
MNKKPVHLLVQEQAFPGPHSGRVPSPITLRKVERGPGVHDGVEDVRLVTDAGDITGRLHPAPGDGVVLWVFGAGGGLGGPAGGLYTRLGSQLRAEGIASLELAYRYPGRLGECVTDVQVGLAWLGTQGKRRAVLVGHSFGGAVVITAGVAAGEMVLGVAALSSQTSGALGTVSALSPRPLLLIHGTADEVLPDTCSRALYARAGAPKQLILYPGCRHGLDQCRDQLDHDLIKWLGHVLGFRGGHGGSTQ